MDAEAHEFGIGRVTRFYVPLLLQGFSQSLTYPLVAGIVSHGPDGVNGLTAFAQGQIVMFLVGALGGGLVTTGLMFAKTRKGYCEFRRLNSFMMAALLLLQCLPAIHPLDKWVFEGFFALPPDLAQTARWTLLYGVVMYGFFFLRNLPMVVLLNNLESGKANIATFLRILATLALAVFLPRFSLVGAGWGLFALTVGCGVEYAVTWLFARRYVRELPGEDAGEHVSLAEQLKFTLPLSLGGFLLMLSPLLIAAFVGRSENAQDMLAIHYVTIGVANPVAFAALRMQTVAIEFPPAGKGDRRLMWYCVLSGAVLGLIPLVFAVTPVGNWYFGSYQNVPPRLVGIAMLATGIYSLIAIVQTLRARMEGLAALCKRPGAVMWGQFGYTAALFTTLFVTLKIGVAGWLMAVSAIFIAPAVAGLVVWATISLTRRGDF